MKTSNKILVSTYLAIILIMIVTMAFVRRGTSAEDPIEAIGDITSVNVNFKQLRALDIAVGQVTLIQKNGSPQIEIKCAENIREHLVQEFEDNEFYLGMDRGKNGDLGIKVIVYIEDIETISLSENARLICPDTFRTETITLKTNQSGSIQMPIQANQINAFTLGGSRIELDGSAKNLNAVVNNSGRIEAIDLNTDTVVANIGDAGKMEIAVNSSLTANLSSAGKLYYKGDPADLQKSGVIDSAALIKL